MEHSKTTSLFRYRACDTREKLEQEVDLIKKQMIWCTSRKDLNDPFDCVLPIRDSRSVKERKAIVASYHVSFGKSRQQSRALARSYVKHNRDAELILIDDMQRGIDKIKFCCFTGDPANVLMWSYYANAHSGICVEYERKNDNKLGDDQITKKVVYVKEKDIRIIDLVPKRGEEVLNKEAGARLMQYTLFHKTEAWDHEEEFRTLAAENDTAIASPGAIVSVTFGLNTKSDMKQAIAKELGPDFKYREMKCVIDTFNIEPKPVQYGDIIG